MKIERAERAMKVTPSWHEVKARLVEFDQVGILSLMHDLYSSSMLLARHVFTQSGPMADFQSPTHPIFMGCNK